MRTNVPIAIRSLRIRRRWRQQDLADQASVSRDTVSRAERGELDGMTVRALSRVVDVLGASLSVEVRWQGARLDRLMDREHAHLQEAAARRLVGHGWRVHAEVSFNFYGDRGSCDLVAWHPATATLVVIEVKSRLGDLQEMLRSLDVKARLGSLLARQLGLPTPKVVIRGLVLAEGRSGRRIVANHASLFSGFDVRGRTASAWLRHPQRGISGILWFEKPADSDGGGVPRAERVHRSPNAGQALR